MPWVSGSSQRFSGKVYSVSATRGLVLEKSFKSFIGSFVPSNLEAIGHRKANRFEPIGEISPYHSERACREQANPCPNSNVTRGLRRLTIRTATSRATEATARTIEAMRRARGGIAFGKEVALKLVNLVHGLTQNVLSGLVATERPQSERTCAGRLRNIPPFRANATTPDSRSRIFGPK